MPNKKKINNLADEMPAIAEHTSAIGFVCVLWAALEFTVDSLIETVVPFEAGKVSESISANVEFRGKLQMLKAVSFIRKPNDLWFADLEVAINAIDNDMRLLRNRYIHDLWIMSPWSSDFSPDFGSGMPGITKRYRKTTLIKPQSFKRELVTFTDSPVDPAEIWELANRIREAERTVALLKQRYLELTPPS